MTYTPHTLEELPGQARRLSAGTMAGLTGYADYDKVDAIRTEFVEFCQETAGHFETWALAWPEFVKAKAQAGEFFLNCTDGGYSRKTFLGIRLERITKIMMNGSFSPSSLPQMLFECSRMAVALEGRVAITGIFPETRLNMVGVNIERMTQ